MNKQLLRLKQRSNNDILQVAESDDSNNLYVNVNDGKLDVGTIDEITNISDVDSVNLVDRVTLIDEVTEVQKAVLYGTDPDGIEKPILINDEGQLDTTHMQSGEIVLQGSLIMPGAAPQYTTLLADYVNPDNEIYDTYMLYITNPVQSNLTLSIRNTNVNVSGITENHEVYTKTIPAAILTAPTADAWSSCFTSIGGVLTDESGDWNDIVPPAGVDVPFHFTAVNDAIYFGHTAQFRMVIPIVGTAGVYNATFVWEYWNGSTWTALSNIQTSHGIASEPFKTAIGTVYKWTTPSDWVSYDIPGDPISRYWVRARCTNFTSLTTAPGIISGNYVLSRNVISYAYKITDGAFNTGTTRIVVSNDTALTLNQALPIQYTLRKF